MYKATNIFSEIQLQYFYISGRLITQDEFINLINNKIKEIEKMHVYDYEKRKELIEFLSEFIKAVKSNDTIKYKKVKNKELLNVLKDVIKYSNTDEREKQVLYVLIDYFKIQIDKEGEINEK